MLKFILLTSMLSLSQLTYAEVITATDNFFHIKISAEVDASPEVTYQQFINVGQWWSSDHTWFGDAKNMTIDAKPGGCFCEKSDMGEVMHMLITGVFPNSKIIMTGGLGPLQEMGLNGAMTWKFSENATNGTTITHEYRVNGGGQKDLVKFAEIVNKVQQLQVGLLVKKLTN